jgi:hypothetical protein
VVVDDDDDGEESVEEREEAARTGKLRSLLALKCVVDGRPVAETARALDATWSLDHVRQ